MMRNMMLLVLALSLGACSTYQAPEVFIPSMPSVDSAYTYQQKIRPLVKARLSIRDMGSSWLISLRDVKTPQNVRIVLSNGEFGFTGAGGLLLSEQQPSVNVAKGDWSLQLSVNGEFITVLLEDLP